ncbi:hypothetical protein NEOKW01_0494 [Nematocida sp. AWRm80]|nr:hypothetical protein NEOKW01_0494 [Nematocida sp. AWRm80]
MNKILKISILLVLFIFWRCSSTIIKNTSTQYILPPNIPESIVSKIPFDTYLDPIWPTDLKNDDKLTKLTKLYYKIISKYIYNYSITKVPTDIFYTGITKHEESLGKICIDSVFNKYLPYTIPLENITDIRALYVNKIYASNILFRNIRNPNYHLDERTINKLTYLSGHIKNKDPFKDLPPFNDLALKIVRESKNRLILTNPIPNDPRETRLPYNDITRPILLHNIKNITDVYKWSSIIYEDKELYPIRTYVISRIPLTFLKCIDKKELEPIWFTFIPIELGSGLIQCDSPMELIENTEVVYSFTALKNILKKVLFLVLKSNKDIKSKYITEIQNIKREDKEEREWIKKLEKQEKIKKKEKKESEAVSKEEECKKDTSKDTDSISKCPGAKEIYPHTSIEFGEELKTACKNVFKKLTRSHSFEEKDTNSLEDNPSSEDDKEELIAEDNTLTENLSATEERETKDENTKEQECTGLESTDSKELNKSTLGQNTSLINVHPIDKLDTLFKLSKMRIVYNESQSNELEYIDILPEASLVVNLGYPEIKAFELKRSTVERHLNPYIKTLQRCCSEDLKSIYSPSHVPHDPMDNNKYLHQPSEVLEKFREESENLKEQIKQYLVQVKETINLLAISIAKRRNVPEETIYRMLTLIKHTIVAELLNMPPLKIVNSELLLENIIHRQTNLSEIFPQLDHYNKCLIAHSKNVLIVHQDTDLSTKTDILYGLLYDSLHIWLDLDLVDYFKNDTSIRYALECIHLVIDTLIYISNNRELYHVYTIGVPISDKGKLEEIDKISISKIPDNPISCMVMLAIGSRNYKLQNIISASYEALPLLSDQLRSYYMHCNMFKVPVDKQLAYIYGYITVHLYKHMNMYSTILPELKKYIEDKCRIHNMPIGPEHSESNQKTNENKSTEPKNIKQKRVRRKSLMLEYDWPSPVELDLIKQKNAQELDLGRRSTFSEADLIEIKPNLLEDSSIYSSQPNLNRRQSEANLLSIQSFNPDTEEIPEPTDTSVTNTAETKNKPFVNKIYKLLKTKIHKTKTQDNTQSENTPNSDITSLSYQQKLVKEALEEFKVYTQEFQSSLLHSFLSIYPNRPSSTQSMLDEKIEPLIISNMNSATPNLSVGWIRETLKQIDKFDSILTYHLYSLFYHIPNTEILIHPTAYPTIS